MTRLAKTASIARWLGALAASAIVLLGTAGRTEAACTVSISGGLAFGSYDVFGSAPTDSTGQFTWRCDFLTFPNVRITLNRGVNSTTYRPRRMRSSTDTLGYYLYLDSARTSAWGDESEGTRALYDQYRGWGNMQVYIYGRIPAGQDVSVGTYSDAVTVVINF